jgi:hypothetical protein
MTINTSALLTAGLLAGLILAGSLIPAHADDGCGGGKKKGSPTAALWSSARPALASLPVRAAWA